MKTTQHTYAQACSTIIDHIHAISGGASSSAGHFSSIQTILKSDIKPYTQNSTIRNFLNATFDTNPLLSQLNSPQYLNRGEAASTGGNPRTFLDDAADIKMPVAMYSFLPDLKAYKSFLENNARFYAKRFGGTPLHGHQYFYRKTMEHFITYYLIDKINPYNIMDIGSAGLLYPNIIANAFPDKKIIAQDLAYPPGAKHLGSNIIQLGGSAASLPLPDESVDFITFHCSFEHFEKNADTDCLKEVERVIRPGGNIIIIPLHTSIRHTVLINPITGPFIDDDFMEQVLRPELDEKEACWRAATGFVSRFARLYSARTFQSRLLSKARSLKATLYSIDIGSHFQDTTILPDSYFNGNYKKYIPHDTRSFLWLRKAP